MKDRALKYYRGEERYNCAQAVLKSVEKYRLVQESELEAYSQKGTGRAEDGLCGALFAAKKEMTAEQKAEARNFFEKNAGSIRCREIRKEGRMSCQDCVAAAAELVENNLKNN